MATTIQLRRDTSTNWSSINPILAEGEFGLELGSMRVKVGDGVTAWNSLGYHTNEKNNDVANVDPTTSDDSTAGYSIGSRWINQTSSEIFRLINATAGAAIWVKTTLTLDELGSAATASVSDFDPAGTADASMTAHLAATDPHPQYTTQTEASAAAPVQSVAGKTGAVALVKSDVGLGSVDNTADVDKPVSIAAQAALNANSTSDRDRANHTGTQTLSTISDAGSAASQTADAAATPNTVPLRDASGRMKTAVAAAADDALARGQLLDGSFSPVVNALTAQGPLTQNPGAGANNSTPLAQYGDLFSDAIVSGLTTATSATLTGNLSSGVAYVLGQRVAYAGGSYTVAASTTSYLDLSTTGVLTVTTSATVTANSLRLWSVTSDASTITTVTQIAENYVTLLGMSVGGGTSTNVFIGYQALLNNTTGVNNTANGYRALFSNTTGVNNTANGVQALLNNTTGVNNTANGFQALFSNTTGGNNTANGYQALLNNTTGGNNTANGFRAGYSNVSGSGSVFIGYLAGYNETLPNKLYISNSDTANPLIYGDFAAGYLRFNGSIASAIGPVLSAINLGSTTTAGNITLTAAQLKSSYFTDSATQTAAFTITTDTAANLLAALPAAAVGSSFTFRFFNNDQSATGFAGTLAAGAGITISTALPNPAVAKGTWADYLFTFTNVTTGSVAVTVSYIGRGTI